MALIGLDQVDIWLWTHCSKHEYSCYTEWPINLQPSSREAFPHFLVLFSFYFCCCQTSLFLHGDRTTMVTFLCIFGADCKTDFYYSISIPTVPIEYCNYILQSRPRNDIFHKIPKFQESKCVREEIIWRRKFLLEAQVRQIYKKYFPKKIIFQKGFKSRQKYNLVEAKRGKKDSLCLPTSEPWPWWEELLSNDFLTLCHHEIFVEIFLDIYIFINFYIYI